VLFEVVAADAVCPDDGADGWLQGSEARHPLVLVGQALAEPGVERPPELGMIRELLVLQTDEIGGPVSLRRSAEVDDSQLPLVQQPFAWLVVALR
jgi:hypothetical protein